MISGRGILSVTSHNIAKHVRLQKAESAIEEDSEFAIGFNSKKNTVCSPLISH
jgi:hypothetical protein